MVEFKVLKDRDHAEALERGRQAYASPRAVSAHLDRGRMCIIVRLDVGADFAFDPSRERSLASATLDELEDVVVEGMGGTIRFPTLDVDLTLANLPDFPGGPR